MRIRRRPSQIPVPGSSDPAARGDCSSGEVAVESVAGGAVVKGEILVGRRRLHPAMEAREKGGRTWGGDSMICRLGQPEGGRRSGSWTGGGSDDSCCEEVQQLKRHKGKVAEVEDGVPRAEEEKDGGAHKTWNHTANGGVSAAAGNGVASDPLASTIRAATGSDSGIAGAARKRKDNDWSRGCCRSARSPSPSSSSSSVKTVNFNGGGVGTASDMRGGDHQLVKDEEEENREEQHPAGGSEHNRANNNNIKCGKRRRSPAVLMEGSRCSRVNGRGWRCGQKTLVGYSLCEHHLGKGRLRSVSSVRCKKASGAAGKPVLPNQPTSAVQQLHDQQQRSLANVTIHEEDDDDDEEKKPCVARGKRIGTVKARSISSLLDQTSSDVVKHAGYPGGICTKDGAGRDFDRVVAALTRISHVENRTPATAATVSSLTPPAAALQ